MSGSGQLILCGYEGRMGTLIQELVGSSKSFSKAVEFSAKGELPAGKNVVIDFSSPEGFRESLKYAVQKSIPFVSGTTGLKEKDFKLLAEASKKIPVLWASNMSVGVQWLKNALSALSILADNYDFQIEEAHHKRKVDSPSGTAISLQVALEKAICKKAPAPISIRGGGIFGMHKIFVMGEEEVITLEHQALDRRVFARGAIQAAEFLKNKKPGQYTMGDVLGLKHA